MNVFDATTKIKKNIHENNPEILKIEDNLELSCCQLSSFYAIDLIQNTKEYVDMTKVIGMTFGLHFRGGEIQVVRRTFNLDKDLTPVLLEHTSKSHNTKEYWQFLHEEFPFCDVMSYPIHPDIQTYFGVKGPLYMTAIDLLPDKLGFFKNKKILEIGGGYGYLPKKLREEKIPHKYYHADIVKRFDCDNYIDLNGYDLFSAIYEKFDVIVMFDVLQHLNLHVVGGYMNDIKYLLNDDGCFLMNTPILHKDQMAIGTFFAQTTVNPSEEQLCKLLDELGFQYTKSPYLFCNRPEAVLYKITL